MNPIFTGLPTKLGLYMLEELLSAHEHTELYAATQSYVDRAVVIEVLRPDSPPDVAAQFQENIRRRASVSLAHVSPMLESVQTGTFSYLIQERPRGYSLVSLAKQGKLLSYSEGFSLVHAVAELYATCHEKGLAAAPPSAASIYMDGTEFTFLSPVEAGVADEAHRDAQMKGLAEVLELILPPEVLGKSKLSVVVYWLKNGYGGAALEWAPLLSALATLRGKKGAGHVSAQRSDKSILHFFKKRYMKRALRAVYAHRLPLIFGALAVLAIGCAGFFFATPLSSPRQLPAVTEHDVCCSFEDRVWCVRSAPVSLGEYANFLKAYAAMNKGQQQRLHEGMPPDITEHQPMDWEKQLASARGGGKSPENTPVQGVSFWDALAYARYAGEQLAPLELVQTARKHARQKQTIEEWTSTRISEFLPYRAHVIICPAQGDSLLRSAELKTRFPQRGFRTAQLVQQNNNTPKR